MWVVLGRILAYIVRGASYVLPFLSSYLSVGLVSLGSFYLIFRWLYSIFLDNLSNINSLIDSCITAIDRLQDFVGADNSSVGQIIMHACAIDSFFSDFTVFITFVGGTIAFLLLGCLASIIGLLVPLIVRRIIQSAASLASKSLVSRS